MCRRAHEWRSMCNACDIRDMEWALFAGIPGDDVRAVLSLARRATYRRGEVVFHRYDPADSLHLVVKGRFDVRITTQQYRQVAACERLVINDNGIDCIHYQLTRLETTFNRTIDTDTRQVIN